MKGKWEGEDTITSRGWCQIIRKEWHCCDDRRIECVDDSLKDSISGYVGDFCSAFISNDT